MTGRVAGGRDGDAADANTSTDPNWEREEVRRRTAPGAARARRRGAREPIPRRNPKAK